MIDTTTTPATKVSKKAKKPAKATPAANGKVEKKGLRKPQVRILRALSKAKTPLTRAQIAEKAPVDLAMQNSYIGSHDDDIRAKNDKKVMPSLLTLKFVKAETHDIDGRDTVVYAITPAGRKALDAVKE